MLPTGTVVHAGRVWVHPAAADLAVLVLTETPKDVPGTAAARMLFLEAPAEPSLTLRRVQADGRPESPLPFVAAEPAPLTENRGAAVVVGDRVVGVYGGAVGEPGTPAVIGLHLLPVDLQPQ